MKKKAADAFTQQLLGDLAKQRVLGSACVFCCLLVVAA